MFKGFIIAATLGFASVAMADDFIIATGSEGGGYEALGYKVAASVKKQADKKGVAFDFEVLNTNGSLENIELFNDGDAQAAIVQADALSVSAPSRAYKSRSAHQEVIYWFANKKNGFTDLEDIEGRKDVVMVLVDGSGASVTMNNFAIEDKGYQVNFDNAVLADDLYDAMDIVSEGLYEGKKVAGLLHVTRAGKISSELREDFGSRIVIGELTDSDFNDALDENKEPLYTSCEVSKKTAAGFKTATTFKPDTLCMTAKVIYTTDFDDKKAKRVVRKGVTKATR
ncbi:hypothetical protein NVP1121O_213 [Vibrio phage 1.121.O._10N.286.46.C4]|nr:hypothetical protein NVP1121O_213 [Vibrio phage 1.121.O._10N.286.46.C4]